MSPPLSVTFKMSTDEGQNGKQCNCKYLDPTVVLEKDKELELPVMNPLTNSIIAVFLWHIIKQINKNKLTQTNKPSKLINSSQTLSFEGRKSEWNTTTSFHHVQVQKEKIDIKVRRTSSQCHNTTPLWGNLWRWDQYLPIHWHLVRL